MFVFDRFKQIIDSGRITDGVKEAKKKLKKGRRRVAKR
jgi:hypothetical protein